MIPSLVAAVNVDWFQLIKLVFPRISPVMGRVNVMI